MRASKWKEKLEFSQSRYGTGPHSISSRQWRTSGIPDTPFMMMTYIDRRRYMMYPTEYEIRRMKAILPPFVRNYSVWILTHFLCLSDPDFLTLFMTFYLWKLKYMYLQKVISKKTYYKLNFYWHLENHSEEKNRIYKKISTFLAGCIVDDHRGFVPPVSRTSPAPRFQL